MTPALRELKKRIRSMLALTHPSRREVCRLTVTALDERIVPSVYATFSAGTLTVSVSGGAKPAGAIDVSSHDSQYPNVVGVIGDSNGSSTKVRVNGYSLPIGSGGSSINKADVTDLKIIGSDGAERINLAMGPNEGGWRNLNGHITVFGYGGNDAFTGSGFQDFMDAGAGDDDISGGNGDDELVGGDGSDTIRGDVGNDTLKGGQRYSPTEAGSKNDYLEGGTGDDVLWGGDGNDELVGGDGGDALYGEGGNDRLKGGQRYVPTESSTANANDLLDGGVGDDVLWGGDGNDELVGGDGGDALYGEGGNDRLKGGQRYVPTESSTANANDLLDGGVGDDVLWGGDGNDELVGGDGGDALYGEGGNDRLKGGQRYVPTESSTANANDLLDGGVGDDVLWGGDGNDELVGGDGGDALYGEKGHDQLFGGAGNDLLFGGADDESDDLIGGTGADLFVQVTNNFGVANDVLVDIPQPEDAVISLTAVGTLRWSNTDAMQIIVGLNFLFRETNNTNLLKLSNGSPFEIMRVGTLPDISGNTTNGLGDNDSRGRIRISNAAFANTSISAAMTTIHEISHNWDEDEQTSGYWSGWLALSRWGRVPVLGWIHLSGEFVREYGKKDPNEDWATIWEAYFMLKTGTLSASEATRLKTKLDFVGAFISSKRSPS